MKNVERQMDDYINLCLVKTLRVLIGHCMRITPSHVHATYTEPVRLFTARNTFFSTTHIAV